jgi:hypothetical protein
MFDAIASFILLVLALYTLLRFVTLYCHGHHQDAIIHGILACLIVQAYIVTLLT